MISKTEGEKKQASSNKPISNGQIDDSNTFMKDDKKYPPLNTPLVNRLQTIFILFHSTSVLIFASIYFLFWCIPYLWPFMLYYTIFHYYFDRSPVNGNVWSKRNEWFRNLYIWETLVNYFPIKFHKMKDLKPTFNSKGERIGPKYIFGYHPHGIIATGVSSGFTNNGTGWNSMFPGIKCFVTTLVNQFHIPFYRDYLMALGVTTVVKKNLKIILKKGGSIVIVVGGAMESLLAKPGSNSIVLTKRKGFIKLALESIDSEGVCVVPVYGFGENDVYDVFYTDDSDEFDLKMKNINNNIDTGYEDYEESRNFNIFKLTHKMKRIIRRFQLFLKQNLGWTLPIVISRGIFNYDFGILPYRKPINVVFGEPIFITRLNGLTNDENVTQEEIDYWHNIYVSGLKKVWSWGKDKYTNPSDEDLKIVQ